jgi:hypothetical protein
MTQPYLIAHKVHGAPAFDVAIRIDCPECTALGCAECNGLGYWFIVPTSGHRAYPWWDQPLETPIIGGMPAGLPDHYSAAPAPAAARPAFLQALLKPKTTVNIERRGL